MTGVRTYHGEEVALRAVVSNCDSVRTHRELINGAVGAKFEKRRSNEAACWGVVLVHTPYGETIEASREIGRQLYRRRLEESSAAQSR